MESATLTRLAPGQIRLARLRAVPPATWAKAALAVMCAGALAGFLAFPTYPTYDSFYALLWGRDLLHLHMPDFQVYRGPTEHPLAIAFGALCSLFGQGGARLMVAGSIASFVAVVAGSYRLGRLCFGPVVGVLAALLVLSRFFAENLAAQGYLDISYVALIVWAIALEVERPRRGVSVFLLLAGAGLLRPDAWVLSGAYWLWCCWGPGGAHGRRTRLRYLALAASAPVIWILTDAIVTGHPFYSLSSTAGIAGASVIDRYLLGAATVALLFCALALGGWAMLEPGTVMRRVWMAGAAALLVYGVLTAATTLSLTSLRTTLAYHENFHKGLSAALGDARVSSVLRRCPLLSLPNHKLIPDARWILDSVNQRNIVARSQVRADAAKGAPELQRRIRAGSVAVYPLGAAVFFEAIVDVGDDPRDQVPLAGFRRISTSPYYAIYANC